MDIQEWFWAAYLVATHTPGFSAKQLERQLGCQYKTAWFMLHRLRRAMINDTRSSLKGDIKADETIIGGPVKGKRGRAVTDLTTKTLIFGAVEVIRYTDKRGKSAEKAARIRLAITVNADEKSIEKFLLKNVEEGSVIRTDGWKGYSKTALLNYAHKQTPGMRVGHISTGLLAISRLGLMVHIMVSTRNTCKLISMNSFFASTAGKRPWPLSKRFWGSLRANPPQTLTDLKQP